ncbi:ArsC family reductase [Thalassotalea atypica]|uniref:ArsC family reductase n=1 Tax=Thalassotalea atypica TaxID=2054316 RepID=UPI002574150D|nr:ArsC family reductase [Thalassotalea atypica]
MTTIYGIHNCDTIKKTQKWLTDNQIEYTFHDFRKDGLTPKTLTQFFEYSDWNLLLNKRSTTYRNLSDEQKSNMSRDSAFELFLEQPTLIKRPVLIKDNDLTVGFKAAQYQEIFT